jgi:hypothetical protein
MPLVIRIWRTQIDHSRGREYDDFARNVSLPMFRRHDDFLGVLFAGADGERVVVTLWSGRSAVASLEASADYQATVRAIEAAGFLRPPQRIELLDVHGSWTGPLSHGSAEASGCALPGFAPAADELGTRDSSAQEYLPL